jgi:hypothetical protein
VIDESGILREKLPWADPERLARSVEAMLAAQPASRPQAYAEPADPIRIRRAEHRIAKAHAAKGTAAAGEARADAAAAARTAWGGTPARLVVALVELAELGDDKELWREALATLEPRAPQTQRTWIEKHLGATSRPSSR